MLKNKVLPLYMCILLIVVLTVLSYIGTTNRSVKIPYIDSTTYEITDKVYAYDDANPSSGSGAHVTPPPIQSQSQLIHMDLGTLPCFLKLHIRHIKSI